MRTTTVTAILLLVLSTGGCSKKEPPTSTTAQALNSASAPSSGSTSTPAAATSGAAPSGSALSTAAPLPSTEAPADFSGGEPLKNAVATGLGCEARTKDGWLQLLCRKKNGAGGHPKLAVLGSDDEAPRVEPDDKGELRIVLPFRSGSETIGTVEWTDTKYNLKVLGTELTLEWAVSRNVQRSCAAIETERKDIVAKAIKTEAPDHLTAVESAKFPRFGVCQAAGLGSWAIGLRNVSATGKDQTRAITFELDVVRIAADGNITRAPLGTIQTRPGGLEIRPLQAYDYDDDGNVELIVPYDVKAVPEGVTPTALPVVWTEQNGKVVPYEKFAPSLGGAQTTHLEFDMRPDIGGYAPFVAYIGSDCGAATCPSRLVGPVRYARSMPTGEFSLQDPLALAAITRGCPKGAALVAEGNPARTAQNVACARLRGEDPAKLTAELKAKGNAFCKDPEHCGLLDALLRFAAAEVDN